jgi:hypothetical protein
MAGTINCSFSLIFIINYLIMGLPFNSFLKRNVNIFCCVVVCLLPCGQDVTSCRLQKTLVRERHNKTMKLLGSFRLTTAFLCYQLLTGHCQLNSYQCRFRHISSPLCSCLSENESIDHFIIRCPLFTSHQRPLIHGVLYLNKTWLPGFPYPNPILTTPASSK